MGHYEYRDRGGESYEGKTKLKVWVPHHSRDFEPHPMQKLRELNTSGCAVLAAGLLGIAAAGAVGVAWATKNADHQDGEKAKLPLTEDVVKLREKVQAP